MKDSYEYKWSPYDLVVEFSIIVISIAAIIVINYCGLPDICAKYKNYCLVGLLITCISSAVIVFYELKERHDILRIDDKGILLTGTIQNEIKWEDVDYCRLIANCVKDRLHFEVKLIIIFKDENLDNFEIDLHNFKGHWWQIKKALESYIGKEDEIGRTMVEIAISTKIILIIATFQWIFIALIFLFVAVVFSIIYNL